jgi:hypothetical protein
MHTDPAIAYMFLSLLASGVIGAAVGVWAAVGEIRDAYRSNNSEHVSF